MLWCGTQYKWSILITLDQESCHESSINVCCTLWVSMPQRALINGVVITAFLNRKLQCKSQAGVEVHECVPLWSVCTSTCSLSPSRAVSVIVQLKSVFSLLLHPSLTVVLRYLQGCLCHSICYCTSVLARITVVLRYLQGCLCHSICYCTPVSAPLICPWIIWLNARANLV